MKLRGMTWSHERGLHPLIAASRKFGERHPGVEIEWDARSLADFELYPLALLADRYDLMMIDHPHIGTAVAQNLLVPLDDLIEESFLEDQKKNSTGLSYASYTYNGRQWALPVDAAAQVSAYRADIMKGVGGEVPKKWKQVTQLADKLPLGYFVGLPLVPVHAYSTFFTLCAQFAGCTYWSEERDLPLEIGEQVMELLDSWMPILHPSSVDCDPIQMLDHMGQTKEIAYVPLIYGYSNYAREGFRPYVVTFTNIPSDTGIPSGSMIGGVGLSISSKCKHIETAVSFCTMVASPEFQKTTFFQHGGQPGHRSAWRDPEVNRLSGNFFSGTLDTLTHGSLRPRFDGYIHFQEQAGNLIREALMNRASNRGALIQKLNEMCREARRGS